MKRFLLGFCLAAIATAAGAQTCLVNDPTGTPLNVRGGPNGPILGALNNGTAVHVIDALHDEQGKRWVYIAPEGPGKRGWVFENFLDCPK